MPPIGIWHPPSLFPYGSKQDMCNLMVPSVKFLSSFFTSFSLYSVPRVDPSGMHIPAFLHIPLPLLIDESSGIPVNYMILVDLFLCNHPHHSWGVFLLCYYERNSSHLTVFHLVADVLRDSVYVVYCCMVHCLISTYQTPCLPHCSVTVRGRVVL